MFKLIKLLFTLVILIAISAGGFIFYRALKENDMKIEGINQDSIFRAAEKTFGEVSEHVPEGWKRSLQDWKNKLDEVDWMALRQKMNISKEDLQEYQKLFHFAVEETEKPEDIQSAAADPDAKPVDTINETVNQVSDALKREDIPPPVTEALRQKSTTSEPPAPKENPREKKKRELMDKAYDLLESAKEENRLSMPGMPNRKEHLKKAVELYKKSSTEFKKLLRSSSLSAEDKQTIQELLPKINMQIALGTKFSTF